MTNTPVRRDPLDAAFYVLSFFFACAALFHMAAALTPDLDPEAPPWRHVLFVAINVACIAGFMRRPWFFIPLFSVLVVQQISSHGTHAIRAWQLDRSFDAPSVGVVLIMPLTVGLLIADVWRRRLRSSVD